MGKCRTCGTELPAQARFCSTCGTPFQLEREPARSDASRWKAIIPTDISAAEKFIKQPQTPLPSIPSIKSAPYINPIPTVRSAPLRPVNAAPTSYPRTAAHQFAAGRSAPLPHVPNRVASTARPSHATRAEQAAPTRVAGGRAKKWVVVLLLATVVVAVAGGGGTLAYMMLTFTPPQPVVSIASNYTMGNTPVGSNGTTLHLKGQKFTDHSAITLLLDGRAAPDAPPVVSDQNGNVSADLPITAAWPLGRHTLTARDADHYASKTGVVIEVVAQGQAHTPGPNGAPPDDASFTLTNTINGQYDGTNDPLSSTETLQISGGNVCKERDNGQQQHLSSLTANNGLPFSEDLTLSCSGTYKSGQISYTETLLTAVMTLTDQGNSYVCHLLTPGIEEQLSGSYTTSGGFSGTVTSSSFPQSDFSCTSGKLAYFNFSTYGGSGTWHGTYVLN